MVARANSSAPLDANNYPIFDSVVQIVNSQGYGSGSLLKGTNWILTSAHVAIDSTNATRVFFTKYGTSQEYGISDLFIHPAYKNDGSTPQYDLALIKLDGVAPSWAEGYEIQKNPYIFGQTVWIAGYGRQSVGGNEAYFPGFLKKSWGANVTDFLPYDAGNITPSSWDEEYLAAPGSGSFYGSINKIQSVSVMDFDDGTEARNAFKFDSVRTGEYGLDTEGIPQPGDSGGPILNSVTNEILGVVTAGYSTYYDPDWTRFGNFGEISVNASPRQFSGWISYVTGKLEVAGMYSESDIVYYDPSYTYFEGTSSTPQLFKAFINGTDYDSSYIWAADAETLMIDTDEKLLIIKNFDTVRVKLTPYGFGNDVFINPLTLSLSFSEAPKTPLPTNYQSNLYGTQNEDTFWDTLGVNQQTSGGEGLDSFRVSGKRFSEYDVEIDGETVVLRRYDNEEVDLLRGVERIVFTDVVVALDYDGNAGKAYRIYKAAFDRDPMVMDGAGLGYWINQMDLGMDLIEVSSRFIDSDEFRSLYGINPTNGEFLVRVYNNVLDRDPDASGYAWWMDEFASNPEKTWAKVLADFSESQENQQNVDAIIGSGGRWGGGIYFEFA